MLELVPKLCRQFNITRIADLTYLDRARLPVMNAIVPQSADLISTYNGKGATREHAIVGAVMEAVERQAAAREPSEIRIFSSSEYAADRVGLDALRCEFFPTEPIPYVRGIDLATLTPVWLPQAVVTMPFYGFRLYRQPTTNGLASGSSLVEATHQALFELIERHIFSLTHFRAHVMPRLSIGDFLGTYDGAWTTIMADDPVGKRLLFPTGDRELDDYVSSIYRTGIALSIVFVQTSTLPALAVAVVSERETNRAHLGMSCSWSSRQAAWRAVTEAMQSRVGDTSGAREDLNEIGTVGDTLTSRHDKLPNGRWFFDARQPNTELIEVAKNFPHDLTAQITLTLSSLRQANIGRVYAVDLTPADSSVAIVRVIAPDLETAILDGRIGPSMLALLNDVSPAAREHFARTTQSS